MLFPLRRVAVLMVVWLLVSSCTDPTIDPFSNDGRYFTVYGFLDALELQHQIRVVPVTRRSAVITSPTDLQADIDAVVTTTESTPSRILGTRRWTHSLEQLSDGTYGHVYTSVFPVTPGNTYTLRVTRSDGIETTAVTTVPLVSDSFILDRRPFTINADSTAITQEIIAPPIIASPWAIHVIYLYTGGGVNTREFVPYGRSGEPTSDGGWRFVIEPIADKRLVDAAIERQLAEGLLSPGDLVVLDGMGIDYRLLDKNWNPPEGEFDPEVLAQPGTLSNVENGYGFFGSVGYYREEWNVREFSQLLGYD